MFEVSPFLHAVLFPSSQLWLK